MSLLIAGVGIYAVTSYDVARRRRELGIRAALGAQRADLVHAVLRRSGTAVCFGVVLGLLIAASATQSVRGLLFGIDAYEPVSYWAGHYDEIEQGVDSTPVDIDASAYRFTIGVHVRPPRRRD